MSEMHLTRDLITSGFDHPEIRTMVRAGQLTHLRRGAYVDVADRTELEQHRLLTQAAFTLAESDSVVSFGSAAALHHLPVNSQALRRVHLTRSRTSSGRIRPGVHVHVAPIASDEAIVVDGVAATSLDRTFADLARTVPLKTAVAAGDAALNAGMSLAAAVDQVERAKRRRGIRTARRASRLIDARSESVGESFSRVILVENGVPAPELQVEIDGPDGFSARVDFYWHDVGVIGEFDGKVKYGRSLRPGEDPGDAVFREKVREDRLREMGFIVVRWIWDDLRFPERLIARVNRARDLASRTAY